MKIKHQTSVNFKTSNGLFLSNVDSANKLSKTWILWTSLGSLSFHRGIDLEKSILNKNVCCWLKESTKLFLSSVIRLFFPFLAQKKKFSQWFLFVFETKMFFSPFFNLAMNVLASQDWNDSPYSLLRQTGPCNFYRSSLTSILRLGGRILVCLQEPWICCM